MPDASQDVESSSTDHPDHTEHPTVEILPDADRPQAWQLVVDGTPQSHVDLADPTHLEFEYVRRMGHVLDLAAPTGQPLSVLHLGAGALTLARYVAATRRGSRQRAVDNDAALVQRVRRELPWDRRAGIRVGIDDARTWIGNRGEASADVVLSDVYRGAQTPAHLTSVEFLTEVARVLRPEGIYLLNIGDGHGLVYTRRQVATLNAVFDEVALVAEPGVLRGRRFGNLVLLASRGPLPLRELSRRARSDPQSARVLDRDDLAKFAVAARPVRDTDAVDSPRPPRTTFAR